jgi:hypothetical protein
MMFNDANMLNGYNNGLLTTGLFSVTVPTARMLGAREKGSPKVFVRFCRSEASATLCPNETK